MADDPPLVLQCPICGGPTTPMPWEPPYVVFSCFMHGVYHFSDKIDLTKGPPPPSPDQ